MLTLGPWALLLQGKAMEFVDVTESNARWVQDFRLKAYASPAKLESIDGRPGTHSLGWGAWDLGGSRVPDRFGVLVSSLVLPLKPCDHLGQPPAPHPGPQSF